MAKKNKEQTINLYAILKSCRDIFRSIGTPHEKRDITLTLVFLRFIGEKFEDARQQLKKRVWK